MEFAVKQIVAAVMMLGAVEAAAQTPWVREDANIYGRPGWIQRVSTTFTIFLREIAPGFRGVARVSLDGGRVVVEREK